MRDWLGWLCVGLLVIGGGAYLLLGGPGQEHAEEITRAWFAALQAGDYRALAHVDATAPGFREGPSFEDWTSEVSRRWSRYEKERDEGRFTIDPQGYALVRACLLGSGTYWEAVSYQRDRTYPELIIRLNFGYGEIFYGSLPRGTTVYLLTYPLGTVKPILLGRGVPVSMDVLDHVDLRVQLKRISPRVEGDETFRVARIAFVPDSAQHRRVEWMF